MSDHDVPKLEPCNSERCFHYNDEEENNCGKYVADFQNNCYVYIKYQMDNKPEDAK